MEDKDEFPVMCLKWMIFITIYFIMKKIMYHLYTKKDFEEMNEYKKTQNYTTKNLGGKRIYEVKEGDFDFNGFEKDLKSMEIEFYESLNNNE